MWEQIKQVLKKNRGTCIIVEDGQPVYVIMPFDDYRKGLECGEAAEKTAAPRFKESANESDLLEKINQEIVDWKTKEAENSSEVHLSDIQNNDELKIEDLPLV